MTPHACHDRSAKTASMRNAAYIHVPAPLPTPGRKAVTASRQIACVTPQSRLRPRRNSRPIRKDVRGTYS